MPTTSTPWGRPLAATHLLIRGTSRWQWGHQWARKISTLGLPSPVLTCWGAPAKFAPARLGAGRPTAGSGLPDCAGNGGRAVPVTVTFWYCCRFASCLSLPSPPTTDSTIATTAITATTAPPISRTGSGLRCCASGSGLRPPPVLRVGRLAGGRVRPAPPRVDCPAEDLGGSRRLTAWLLVDEFGDGGGDVVRLGLAGAPGAGERQHDQQRERRQRHGRDGEVPERVHPDEAAGVVRVAGRAFEVGEPLHQHVVD